MDHSSILLIFSDSVQLLSAFLCAFIITYFSIPIIVRVSRAKKLFDLPNNRTSHQQATPTLGGIAMFAAVLITCLLFVRNADMNTYQYVIAGGFILFFFGIKDDLTDLSWKMKVLGECLAAFFLIVLANMRITDLHGILGIHQIGYLFSVLLTFVVMIGIVNAMNLIDGIDGLAAGLTLMASLVFGIWFYLTGHLTQSIIAISMVGMLLAYLGFNVFGTTHKIFMGDTGALILGYLMTLFVIRFNQSNILLTGPWHIHNAPIVSFAILFIPLFDTIRVMVYRMWQGHSPFFADRNHIHHRILNLGFSHIQTTMILMLVNGTFILTVFLLQGIEIHLLTLVVVALGVVKSLTPRYIRRRMRKKVKPALPAFRNQSKELAKASHYDDMPMRN